jgi:hypothetical protein
MTFATAVWAFVYAGQRGERVLRQNLVKADCAVAFVAERKGVKT